VQGNGNSNAPCKYSFTDEKLSSGKYAYRLKQIDNSGTFKYSQEVEVLVVVPKVFALNQNYPNPFNPNTTIEFTLAENGFTSLKVFDILGRGVATLVNESLKAGIEHQVLFDAAQLSSGIYFYKLECGKQLQVRKLILMK
jgi:hypothetical protein